MMLLKRRGVWKVVKIEFERLVSLTHSNSLAMKIFKEFRDGNVCNLHDLLVRAGIWGKKGR